MDPFYKGDDGKKDDQSSFTTFGISRRYHTNVIEVHGDENLRDAILNFLNTEHGNIYADLIQDLGNLMRERLEEKAFTEEECTNLAWRGRSVESLLERIYQTASRVQFAIDSKAPKRLVLKKLVDLANYVLMTWDIVTITPEKKP